MLVFYEGRQIKPQWLVDLDGDAHGYESVMLTRDQVRELEDLFKELTPQNKYRELTVWPTLAEQKAGVKPVRYREIFNIDWDQIWAAMGGLGGYELENRVQDLVEKSLKGEL